MVFVEFIFVFVVVGSNVPFRAKISRRNISKVLSLKLHHKIGLRDFCFTSDFIVDHRIGFQALVPWIYRNRV